MNRVLFNSKVPCEDCGSSWTTYESGTGKTFCAVETSTDVEAPTIAGESAYKEVVEETAIYPESGTQSLTALMYTVLGLTGEAGEVADKLKKVLREDRTLEDAKVDLVAELGDVLWYVHRVAAELGVSMEDVQGYNANKLLSRKARNVLKGSGDNR